MVTAAQQEKQRNDIFCPRLANPQATSKLETLMTTNNAQMVKLWGQTDSSDATRPPAAMLFMPTVYTHSHTQRETKEHMNKHMQRGKPALAYWLAWAGVHDAGHTQCAHTHTQTHMHIT